ncbi:hypothetical protein SDC9_128383 [bioreactor metagenome]|uniref:Uncharacterized protein n=1 Tax=bioreactor metagenome TaxID=1076179 RepID=A0A645CWP6_9ZZZZ
MQQQKRDDGNHRQRKVMHRRIGQRQQQQHRPEDHCARQHRARRKDDGRQRILLQQPPRVEQARRASPERIAKRHPGQRPHDQVSAHARRRRILAQPHGKHHIEHQIVGRHRQQWLDIRPQHPGGRPLITRDHLAPRENGNQPPQTPQLREFREKNAHVDTVVRVFR